MWLVWWRNRLVFKLQSGLERCGLLARIFLRFLMAQVLQTGSNDVKVLASVALQYVARERAAPLSSALLKLLVPALLTAAKEKNTAVRAGAESALVSVIRLRAGEDTLQVGHLGGVCHVNDLLSLTRAHADSIKIRFRCHFCWSAFVTIAKPSLKQDKISLRARSPLPMCTTTSFSRPIDKHQVLCF